jgi:O-antigen ligase
MLLIILMWMGLLIAENTSYESGHVKRSYYWFYTLTVASLPFARFNAEKLIKAFLAGLTFTAVLSILQYSGLAPLKSHGIPMGLLSSFHHIILSLLLVFGILVLSFYFKTSNNRRISILILSLMVIYFIDLTIVVYGRSGYIAFMLTAPLIIHNMFGKKQFIFITVIYAVMLCGLLASPTVQKRIGHAKSDIMKYSDGNTNTSLGMRLEMWKTSFDLFREHPFIGTGSSGFKSKWERTKPYETASDFATPHNTFFYVASGYGVPGIITITWLFIALFISGWRSRSTIIGFTVLSFALVFFIGSLANTMIFGSVKTAWASVFIGLQAALYKNS